MKLRTLVIAVAVLAALAGVVSFVNRPSAAHAADPRVGQPVIPAATAEKTAKVRLTADGKTVELAKAADGVWRVTSYYDFPADFDKLARFIDDLTSAKVDRFVSAQPAVLARLEFKDSKCSLFDAAGAPLLELTLGKSDDAGGRFLRFGSEDKAFQARFDPSLDTDPKNWADATLLKLTPDDIAKIELSFPAPTPAVGQVADLASKPAPSLTFTREKKDAPWVASQTPTGQRLKTDALSPILNNLSSLRFTDTTASDDASATTARANVRTSKFTTFDGKAVTIALGRKPEEKRPKPPVPTLPADIKPAATYPPALPTKPDAAAAPTEVQAPAKPAEPEFETIPAGPVFAFVTHSDASAPVNALMQKRAFEVTDYLFTSLPQKPEDVFEPLPPPPTPPAAAAPTPPAKDSAAPAPAATTPPAAPKPAG